MKRFQLKKLKVNEALSEETLCFSADLYENGKLIAHIGNRGHGGSNDIQPAKGLTYKDIAHIDNIDTECEIMEIACEMDIVQKHQGNSLVLKKGSSYSTQKFNVSISKIKKTHGIGAIQKFIDKAKADGYEILNTNL